MSMKTACGVGTGTVTASTCTGGRRNTNKGVASVRSNLEKKRLELLKLSDVH